LNRDFFRYGNEYGLYNKIYSNSLEHDCSDDLAKDFEHFYRIKTDKSYKWDDGSCYDPYDYIDINYGSMHNRLEDYSPQRPCEI
jgi:hypothetical protein